ncbi:MAG TPA: 5-(carboxyamino)imidazole ribonucleotide synthase [Anaerolineales bacterium]|nr:5-(carboxyamino)imidazole ribonucleotide synthase [Anaerolineales bacterium]
MTILGVIGGGQLGRMLALAAAPLGVRCRVLEPGANPPAAPVAEVIGADYDDPDGLARLAHGAAAVTFEFENVPAAAVDGLARLTPVFPGALALATAQDRVMEKALFRQLGIAIPPMRAVEDQGELTSALEAIGLPAVLKTRRLGYDGKGQAVLRSLEDVEPAWRAIGAAPAISEAFVEFQRELSILSVRGRDGATVFYPLVENHHHDGILRHSIAPAPNLTIALQQQAEAIAQRVLDALDYVGVLAIELFQVGDTLLANEMAPRVHNSGHWTIEGATTSQFENHVRAVLGLPLGATDCQRPTAMINLIGALPSIDRLLAIPGAHVHVYGKAPRLGRKLGHVTLCGDSYGDLQTKCARVQTVIADQVELNAGAHQGA